MGVARAGQVFGKDKSSKEVNKEEGRGKSLEKNKKSLEKDLLVERESRQSSGQPHTGIDGEVAEENEEALQKLLEVAHVHILSYVISSSERKVHQHAS